MGLADGFFLVTFFLQAHKTVENAEQRKKKKGRQKRKRAAARAADPSGRREKRLRQRPETLRPKQPRTLLAEHVLEKRAAAGCWTSHEPLLDRPETPAAVCALLNSARDRQAKEKKERHVLHRAANACAVATAFRFFSRQKPVQPLGPACTSNKNDFAFSRAGLAG
jgi:hypothetical protein